MEKPNPKAPRKTFKVKHGNSHITVYPWTHPKTGAQRWRFSWQAAAGAEWKYKTCRTKTEAEEEAKSKLEALESGQVEWELISEEKKRWLATIFREVADGDEEKVLRFIRTLNKSSEIVESVTRFMAGLVAAKGEETPHIVTMRREMEAMAGHFKGRSVAEIHLPDLQAWLDERATAKEWKWKRKKDVRAYLVQFWKWAQSEGIAGNEVITVAKRLQQVATGEKGELRIFTEAEFRAVAQHLPEEFRPWLVLGCFAGLRPEEIAPGKNKKKGKRGIRCEEIDWQWGVIRVMKAVSKVNRARVVPMNDACRAWLEWAGIREGMTGPVCLLNASDEDVTAAMGKLVFKGAWPKDISRHSYGSNRNAILRSLEQVAEEMGTSVAMLHDHYHNPRAQSEGEQWFAMRPSDPICSDETEVTTISGQKATA